MEQKWYTKPEMMVGSSALIVSLVAVLVSVYSAYVDRAYARASVWPRITISKSDFHRDGVPVYEYRLINAGTGPAINKYAYVHVGDKYYKSWNALFSDFDVVPISTQSHLSTRVLPADQSFPVQTTGNKKFIEKWREIDSDIRIEICYCSIYEECWIVDRSNQPQEVGACLADPEKAFGQ